MLVPPRRSPRSARALVVASIVALTSIAGVTVPGTERPADAALGSTAARYASLAASIRVLDTRSVGAPIQRLPADSGLSIAPVTGAVAAAAGVDADDVVAVVANVTIVGTDGAGFATVFPTGEPLPPSSSINADGGGQTVANMVTARLGAGRMISVYSSIGTDVLIDVQGVYVTATSATAGRMTTITAERAADTRFTSRVPAGGSIDVDLTPFGVPADASAAVLNVTSVLPSSAGFVTVWNGVGTPPEASNLNYTPGSIVPNQVIAGLNAGNVSVFTSAETDLLVDVVGYMTGGGGAPSSAGLFVATPNGRLLDSRADEPPTFATPLAGDTTLTITAAGQVGIPATGVAAISTNTTMTNTTDTGFLTVWGGGTRPNISALNNVGAGRTVANHVITELDGAGRVRIYTFATTDVIMDVTGYFTDGTEPPPDDPLPAPLDVTDMSLTGPLPPPTATGDPNFDFLFESANVPNGYGRWQPCNGVIEYAINGARATQTHIDQMFAAFRVIEEHSGFDFVPFAPGDLVLTDAGLDDRRPPPGADVVIGFSDAGASPILAGGVLGVGGGFWFTSGPRAGEVNTGFVLVDVIDLGVGDDLLSAITHETGHMVGLDHVNDISQIMFPFKTDRTVLGDGDEQGLFLVGTAQPSPPCTLLDPRGDLTDLPEPVLVERAHDVDQPHGAHD